MAKVDGKLYMSKKFGCVLLILVAPLLVATSRPLVGKRVKAARVALPAQLLTAAAPVAFVGEHVNNQGCFSRQALNVAASITIKNASSKPLILSSKAARLEVDGKLIPKTRRGKPFLRGKWDPQPDILTIAPGQTATFSLYANRALPKAKLETISKMLLEIASKRGTIRVEFSGLDQAKAVRL